MLKRIKDVIKRRGYYNLLKDLTIPLLTLIVAVILGITQLISWYEDRRDHVIPKSGWLPKKIESCNPHSQEFDIEIVNVGKTDVVYVLELSSTFADFVQDIKSQDSDFSNFKSYKIFLGAQQTKLNSYIHHVKLTNITKPNNYDFSNSNAYIELKIFKLDTNNNKNQDTNTEPIYKSRCYYDLEEDKGIIKKATLNRYLMDTSGNSKKQYLECKSL